MTDIPAQPQTASKLLTGTDETPPPSAASAGSPDLSADGQPLVPVTAWTSPEDCEALARGLPQRASPAEWAFARLSRMIEDFESKLDKDQEVGCTFVGLPGAGSMRIEDIGYWAPDLLLFYGKTSQGRPERLVQHYTQLNVLLVAEPKEVEQEPPRRIGFALRERMEKVAAEGAKAPPPTPATAAPAPRKAKGAKVAKKK